jgi:hypothetical protein
MVDDIVKIIHFLHTGSRRSAAPLIDDLKLRALMLDEKVQQDVLIFAEQVYFQYDYDPWHCVTKEVQQAADQLIDDLGFHPPANEKI